MNKEPSIFIFRKYIIVFLLTVLLVIDQLTKYLASTYIPLDTMIFSFLGFGLTYKMNAGLIFGIGKHYEYTIMISVVAAIIILPIIILAYRYYVSKYRRSIWLEISLAFVVASILGNQIDRSIFSYVRDFIVWPGPGIANCSDIYVDIGIVFLIIELKKNSKLNLLSSNFKDESHSLREFILYSKKEVKEYCRRALTRRSS